MRSLPSIPNVGQTWNTRGLWVKIRVDGLQPKRVPMAPVLLDLPFTIHAGYATIQLPPIAARAVVVLEGKKTPMPISPFPPTVQTIFEEFIPICKQLAGNQRYAISVGGSLGKGTWDSRSDIDFRLFTDRKLIYPDQQPELWVDYYAAIERWKKKGINIDGVWPRTVGEIDVAIDSWFSGTIQPGEKVWTIWGYYVLTDINNQYVIEDPYGIIAAWKERLRVYPAALKQAVLDKNLASMRYWRGDYHYAHKVERGDVVFLAGISSRLVHEIIQILFALNETYYVGDGANLAFVEKFKIAPANFSARVQAILYPQGDEAAANQYSTLVALIDEVISLAYLQLPKVSG